MKNTTEIFQELYENVSLKWDEESNTTAAGVKFDTTGYNPFTITWVHYVEIGVLALLTLIGVPANGILLFVKLKSKDRTSSDYFVITLATFDFIGSIYSNIMLMFYSGFRKYIISPTFCRFINFGSFFTAFGTAFLIGAMAVDRFVLSILPLNTVYSANIAKWICVIICTLSVILTSPYFLFQTVDKFTFHCTFVDEVKSWIGWWNVILVGLVFITFVMIIGSYLPIAIMLRKRNAKLMQLKRYADISNDTNKRADLSVNVNMAKDSTQTTEPSENDVAVEISQIQKTCQQRTDCAKSRTQTVNRTTLILFLISLVYMISWTVASVGIATNFAWSLVVAQLTPPIRRMTMVFNPLLYMSMSSKFKSNLKEILCNRS